MRHFHRTHLLPSDVIEEADAFFPAIGLTAERRDERARSFRGPLGVLELSVRPEGGHYTFVEAATDQMGESRLDRNVKRFFVRLHKRGHPTHPLDAAY